MCNLNPRQSCKYIFHSAVISKIATLRNSYTGPIPCYIFFFLCKWCDGVYLPYLWSTNKTFKEKKRNKYKLHMEFLKCLLEFLRCCFFCCWFVYENHITEFCFCFFFLCDRPDNRSTIFTMRDDRHIYI